MQQLFHTTCSDNRGFNRAPGFGVLAASCPTEREIPPQVKDLAPYPFSLIRMGVALPIRWVWQKTTNGTSMLVHCAYVGGANSGRVGTHFSHILFDIPSEKGLREILGACAFPFWKQTHEGPPNLPSVYSLPPGVLPSDTDISQQIQDPEWLQLCEVALAICLDFDTPQGKKQIALPAENELVLKLLQFLVRVLPGPISSKLTFSSLEQRDGSSFKIIGVPREHLALLAPSTATANLIQPECVEGELPEASKDYASWCLAHILLNDWSEIQNLLQLAEQCQVESGSQLLTIWKFRTAPQDLSRDEVSEIVLNPTLAAMAFEQPTFRQRALECAVGDPLDSPLLRLLHQQEKTARPSKKTIVEEGLMESAVLAAESNQLERLQSIIEELRWFHRVMLPTFRNEAILAVPAVDLAVNQRLNAPLSENKRDNRELGILTAGFGERMKEILSRLNQRLLTRAALKTPSVQLRLELLSHGRQWLTQESKNLSIAYWLAAENESECLALIHFLEQDRSSEAALVLIVQVLSNYLQSVTQDLTNEPRLLNWLWNCPASVLAHTLAQVGAAQAKWLSVIWRGSGFRQDEFFSTPLPRPNQPSFESVYDVARVELLPETIRQFIRDGNQASLSRVAGLRDVDVLHIANAEMLRELHQPADLFDHQVAEHITSIVNSYNLRNFSAFVRSNEIRWPDLSAPAATWILERCVADQYLDELQILGWIEALNDTALPKLLNSPDASIRVNSAYACLQRELPFELTNFDAEVYCSLLGRIATTITDRSATGQELDVTQIVSRAIQGLVRYSTPELLTDLSVQDRLIQFATKMAEFLPLLESSLAQVPDATLFEQFQEPDRKTRWETILRLVERNYEQNITTIRTFVAKLIFVELCNPWFRISNTLGLQHHLNYAPQDDCLTRRIIAARFLVSESDTNTPTFPELLRSLQHEEPRFQEAFFRVLRQSGEATFKKLLRPFRDPNLDRSISILDRRFDELYQLWQNDRDYMQMLSHFANADHTLFNEPRTVAAALFPLVRHASDSSIDSHRKLVEQLILTWTRQIGPCSPDEVYWQLRECTADLATVPKSRFLELCSQATQAIKHDLGPEQSKSGKGSWFRSRRTDQT